MLSYLFCCHSSNRNTTYFSSWKMPYFFCKMFDKFPETCSLIEHIEDFMRWCPTFAVSLSTILNAFCQYLKEARNYVSMIDIPHLHYNMWEYRSVLMPKEDIQCYHLGSLSCNEWSVYMNICYSLSILFITFSIQKHIWSIEIFIFRQCIYQAHAVSNLPG